LAQDMRGLLRPVRHPRDDGRLRRADGRVPHEVPLLGPVRGDVVQLPLARAYDA
jgi:hypothetical protein